MSGEERSGPKESLSWENQTWAFLNSGSDVEEIKSGNKPPRSSSGSPTVEELPPPPGKKRERATGLSGNGGKDRNESDDDENGKVEGKGGAAAESDHEIHIWTERERRKKMRTMFANLHALLPQLPAKADKSSIVDEAVNYIKTLQQTVQKLQKQKLERFQNGVVSAAFGYDPPKPPCEYSSSREAFLADQGSSNDLPLLMSNASNAAAHYPPAMFQTWTSSNVVLSICGGEAQITVCSAKKPGVFATICYVLEKHKIEVVSAHISSDFNRSMFMIQAHANKGSEQFGEGLLVEDTFKQAAGDIIFWLSS